MPKVDDVSFVDDAIGGDGEEDLVMGEGVVVSSSSLERSKKSFVLEEDVDMKAGMDEEEEWEERLFTQRHALSF
ncbi:hypothetical protein Tco_0878444 [Tanacetum coccineum]|uniref:Uncharacterized protein n=1 Tax=Tanacetum coccineum TaxID=301880 RepID=A0ABQ5C135_9ASTR